MRSLVRFVSVIALAALVVPASASAAKKPKPTAWAAKHKLKGAWKAKDADRDGLKNLHEFKLGTHPRKADTDGDGVKDGAEHAGVVTAFDGETVTIRQFNGPKLTAILDAAADCGAYDDAIADESVADDEDTIDDGFVDVTDEGWVEDDFPVDASGFEGEEEVIDVGDEEDAEAGETGCDLAKGDVLQSAEIETFEGETFIVAFELA